jgi:pimeloyl-ACP methyl ester carboxylesterase
VKKVLIKLLKIFGITLLIFLTGLIILIFFTGPKLPDNTDTIIDNVITSKLPEFVKGKSGYVISDNYKIWYESITPKDPNKGAVLLFMGMASDALGWPQTFIDKLLASGFQVIRYDYRGTGLSDWVENWQQNPYSLSDLAKDAKIILDTLKISKAHLIGLSLGGMVAQEFAIENVDRTLTLTSIMSSGNIVDKELPKISKSIVFDFTKIGIKYGLLQSEKHTIKLILSAKVILCGDAQYDIDVKGTAEQVLYNLKKRKGYNPNVSSQHDKAAKLSGSRYENLKDLKIPVLIIHGVNDPLVSIEHSKKLASVIPNSKTKWFKNMGHDIPLYLIDPIVKEIISNITMNTGK